ncbi:MAG: GDSL-type esterase/lipase family protein [Patescibacteria group bacterium]
MSPIQLRRSWIIEVACLLTGFMLFFAYSQLVRAEATISPWLTTAAPTLDKLADVTEANLPTAIANGNQPCEKRDVITRPQRFVPIPQTKQSHSSCVINTAYGAVSSSGFLQRPGSTVSGAVRSSVGGSTTLLPIPRSSTGLVLSGGGFDGSNLYFFDNLDMYISSVAINNGEVTHKLPPLSAATVLRDRSGNLITATYESMSFSANGDWLVIYVPSTGMIRVNTKTREILPFGAAVNTGSLGPSFRTAISPDGKYAVVASKVFDILKLYDLSTCAAVPNSITAPVACSSRDLRQLIKGNIPGFASMITVRFRSNYTLDFYNSTQPGSPTPFSHHVLVAAGQQASGFQYLALGDSFAAGEGAYAYKALTDTNDNKCHLSQVSYPYLISSALGYGEYESVACSGAVIDDIVRKDDEYEGQVKDGKTRLDRNIDNVLKSFSSGYLGQKEFLEKHSPKLITISTIGNDIGFADKIKRCLGSDTCYETYEDRLEIVQEINQQFDRLTDMYSQIKGAGDPRAKIYIIGYPQIGDPSGNCALNVHLNQQELQFANDLVSYLNSVIKIAATKIGVAYVDVENAFAGHRLCETDSWNVAVNGLTNGNDIVDIPFVHGPIANESYHPTAFGQYLLKTAILDKTANLSLPMPSPNSAIILPDIQSTLPILNAPKSTPTRPVHIIQSYTGNEADILEFGKTWAYEYTGLSDVVQVGSSVKAVLNSAPVNLGEFPVDASGNVTITTNIPNSVPTGFHTLHLYGKNSSGEEVDIYKTVYVSNGTPANSCTVVEPSNIDTDKDNQDDACDRFIDQTPIVAPPSLELSDDTPNVEVIPITPPTLPPINEDLPSLIVTPTPIVTLPPINTPVNLPVTDPQIPTENPQTTAPPDTTNNPQDTKPPENNPETVAGHEELVNPSSETASSTPIQLVVATHRSFPPPLTDTSSPASPQEVAAATTTAEEKPLSYDQEITELATQTPRKEYNKWLLIPVALLILATLSVLIMVIRRPK